MTTARQIHLVRRPKGKPVDEHKVSMKLTRKK